MESEATPAVTSGHNGGGAFQRSVTHAAEGAHHKIDSISSSGKPAIDRIAASTHQAVDKVLSVASHAVETLDVTGEQLHDAEKRLVASTRKYVQEHPAASVGMAIAAGYVLSRVFSSRGILGSLRHGGGKPDGLDRA